VKIIDFDKKIEPENLRLKLKNGKIEKVGRRQKIIIFNLDNGDFLATHLKMTGQYVFKPKQGKSIFGGHGISGVEKAQNKYTHVVFYFKDDSELYYNDLRKFGWLKLLDKKELDKLLTYFGIEPLSNDFGCDHFKKILKKYPKKKIKLILMDQKRIAGIGNIYAAEILFASKVMPDRPAEKLTEKEKRSIYNNIKRILSDSIKAGGTAENHYKNSNQTGAYRDKLKVYGRKGEKCVRCGSKLKNMRLGGRSSVYCPNCQT
jgi:formamidopyrimidine-DNA glycosylase